MSRIVLEELIDNDVYIFFDIDGVLAPYEFGSSNHRVSDDVWNQWLKERVDIYGGLSKSKILYNFIHEKGTRKVYVCSRAREEEKENKKKFVVNKYGIPEDHIFFVDTKEQKLSFLKDFCRDNHIDECDVAIVDDAVDTLDLIADNGDFCTVHVSSFL